MSPKSPHTGAARKSFYILLSRWGAAEADVVAWLKIIYISTRYILYLNHTSRSLELCVLCIWWKKRKIFPKVLVPPHTYTPAAESIKHILAYSTLRIHQFFGIILLEGRGNKVSRKQSRQFKAHLFHLSTFFHRLYYLRLNRAWQDRWSSLSHRTNFIWRQSSLTLVPFFLAGYFLIINCHVENFWRVLLAPAARIVVRSSGKRSRIRLKQASSSSLLPACIIQQQTMNSLKSLADSQSFADVVLSSPALSSV